MADENRQGPRRFQRYTGSGCEFPEKIFENINCIIMEESGCRGEKTPKLQEIRAYITFHFQHPHAFIKPGSLRTKNPQSRQNQRFTKHYQYLAQSAVLVERE